MLKIEQLKESSQKVIRQIAKASNMTPEKVLRVMIAPSRSGRVTTHLNYGITN